MANNNDNDNNNKTVAIEVEIEQVNLQDVEEDFSDTVPDWDVYDWFSQTLDSEIRQIVREVGVDSLSTQAELIEAAIALEESERAKWPTELGGFESRKEVVHFLKQYAEPPVCGCGCELATKQTPKLTDHLAWRSLVEDHGQNCPWVKSRGLAAPSNNIDHARLGEFAEIVTSAEDSDDLDQAAEVASDWIAENS